MRPPLDVRIHAIITGLGSVVASILLPSLVIGAYAIVQRDVHRIASFAVAAAEPLALVAAVATTAFMVARTATRQARPSRWGAICGSVAATCMLAAAWWVGDVDRWTAAAVALLPLAGLTATTWPVRPSRSRVSASSPGRIVQGAPAASYVMRNGEGAPGSVDARYVEPLGDRS